MRILKRPCKAQTQPFLCKTFPQYFFIELWIANNIIIITAVLAWNKCGWNGVCYQNRMEGLQRKEVRVMSTLGDLRLEGSKEGELEERRRARRMCPIKDDDEVVYFEPFTKIYRKKKPHDRKIIADSLAAHFTFSYLPEEIRDVLIDKFSFCKVEEAQYLIRQGDNASCFFILHEGKMTIEMDGQIKKRIGPADGGFGELALLFNAPRSASVRAQTNCFLWYIDRKTFKTAVEEVISSTYSENKAFIDKSMYLSELSNAQRQAVADIAMSQYYEKYSKICQEGQLASCFYILKSGRIRRIKEGLTRGFIEKGEMFEQEVALNEEVVRNQTLITQQNSHILAFSTADIKKVLGRSLHIVLIRNQLKAQLRKQAFFQKLNKEYAGRLLDSFMISACEKGKCIIDTYKKQKNVILFILEGEAEFSFPKFISAKSQKILSSIKDIKSKEHLDYKQLFGVQALRKASSNQRFEEYFEFNLQLATKGRVAKTSLAEIQKLLGCNLAEAIKKSSQEKEERRVRTSKVHEMRDMTKRYQLNQFSARKVLGSGAYGKVLLVTHQKQNLNYALKCISKRPLVKHKHLEFIKAQKETLSLITLKDCPFVVKYYRSFKDCSYIYFLTEYIEGRDLFDVIRAIGILTLEQTRFYIAILIHMLEFFSQESLIYRDLKPENIMVGRDGYLKLVDLGTCKKMYENQNKTFSFIGTPEYMAPEVFIHKGYSYSADLWSLGIIFYELLAGRNPFIDVDTEDMKEIYDQIMGNPLQFPNFMKDSVHPLMRQAKNLIAQLLDKTNPCNRLGGSFHSLKSHPFFSGFDWNAMINKSMAPAYLIKNDQMLSEDKIKQLSCKPILTYLKDGNCEMPKVKGVSQGWDQFFAE